MAATNILTDEDRETIKAALPSIRRAAPAAAKVIDRLVRAYVTGQVAETGPYASIPEVAAAYDVTPQTIRNWADRGWLPCERTFSGTRRFPRSLLASAQALGRPRPGTPDLSRDQVEAIISSPRRRT